MKWLRKSPKIVDERVVNLQNKIYKEIYIVVMILCILSMAIKFYLYGIGTSLVTTELVILIAQSFYFIFRSVKLGIYSAEIEVHDQNSKFPMSLKNGIIGLGSGALISLFFGIRSAMIYADGLWEQMYTFILVFFASMMVYLPIFLVLIFVVYIIAKRSSEKMANKELD